MMSFFNVLRDYVLKLKNYGTEISDSLNDSIKRNWIIFVQFFAMKKADKKKIYSRYKMSDAEKEAVDRFYKSNYGKKIDYKWHRYFASFTGHLDPKFIPLNIYFSEIEFFLNPYKKYNSVLSDKSIITRIAKSIDIKIPKTYLICSRGYYINANAEFLSKEEAIEYLLKQEEFFIKPTVDSCGGKGCTLCSKSSESIDTAYIEKIFQETGNDFIAQEVIRNHESISKIYSKSLNTFRVGTYNWQGEIYTLPMVMRLGRNGATVDNASSGGVYIAVEDDGQLHEWAYSDYGEKISEHPDSKIKFGEYKIASILPILESAKRLHRSLPMLGMVNWDFALDKNGDPVLIEANIGGGGVDMQQNAWGKGLFGEHTEEILQWTKLMRNTDFHARAKYYFGKGMK